MVFSTYTFNEVHAEEPYGDGELVIDPLHDNGEDPETVSFELEEDPLPEDGGIQMFSATPFSSNQVLGFKDSGSEITVNVYTTATSSSALTYISNKPSYNGDAAILAQSGKRYKIKIAGVVGWVDFNSNYMEIIDTSAVKSISHYQVDGNGDLWHYLSTGPKGTSYSRVLNGKAPSYLTEKDTQYYSYDGHYFYKNKDTMINNYKAGGYNDSINPSKPFFNYFQYLPYRSLSNISGKQLDNYITNIKKYTEEIPVKTNAGIKANQSNMVGAGSVAVWQGNNYGANGVMSFALAIHESAWGRSYIAANKKNLFGHAAYDSTPGSATEYEHIYDSFWSHNARFLNWNYLDFDSSSFKGGYFGNKESGINVKYASDPYWGEKAASHYHALDRYFGNADYNGYRLGVKKSSGRVNVLMQPKINSAIVRNPIEKYDAILKESNQVVVILGEVKGDVIAGSDVWYKISIDSLVESSTRNLLYIGANKEQRETGYDFNNSYGYVHSTQLSPTDYDGAKVIKPPVTEKPNINRPTDPKPDPTPDPKPDPTPDPKPDEKTRLDLNGDKVINISDMMVIRRHALGVKLLYGNDFSNADLNKDGNLDISDMMVIRRYMIKEGS